MLPGSSPPSHNASGGVVFIVIQVIVEADDGADELSQLHKVSRYDVDAVLPRPLRSDPLHHTGQGPGTTQDRRPFFTQRSPHVAAHLEVGHRLQAWRSGRPHEARYRCYRCRIPRALTEGILKDVYMKVTQSLVGAADSGVTR